MMQLCCCIVQEVLKPKLSGDWKNIQGRSCYMIVLFSALIKVPLFATVRERTSLHRMDASAVAGFT